MEKQQMVSQLKYHISGWAEEELTSLGSDVGTASSLNTLEPEVWRCGSSFCAPTFSGGSEAMFDGCLNVCLRILRQCLLVRYYEVSEFIVKKKMLCSKIWIIWLALSVPSGSSEGMLAFVSLAATRSLALSARLGSHWLMRTANSYNNSYLEIKVNESQYVRSRF